MRSSSAVLAAVVRLSSLCSAQRFFGVGGVGYGFSGDNPSGFVENVSSVVSLVVPSAVSRQLLDGKRRGGGMAFYADLHIHSRFSRATSREGDLEHLSLWSRRKGVHVLGTGDFTHPEWFQEIQEQLVPAEPGLFRLRPDLEARVEEWLGGAPAAPPTRFLLEVEISTIYKKGERTRKVHHLLYAPDLEKAQAIRASLERIGNIASDGRPILGLDSRDLLEITLEAGDGCYLIPAHIWTPWFAAMGSKSGFDSIEECYGDLAGEIFAVETGLSSDPPMSRRLSQLDRYTLVSNSDAHSPPKIGREACAFECELDYFAMRRALETREGYAGTVEFFAEEGKYHNDGHRKCGVSLEPEAARERDGNCPVCGKALTLGVLHRVSDLADRAPGEEISDGVPFRSLIPLDEVLAELHGVGPKTKTVAKSYSKLTGALGSELDILESVPLDDVARVSSSLVAEALSRLRQGQVHRQAGFDGEYGVIRLFEKDELERERSGPLFFDLIGEGVAPEPVAVVATAANEASGPSVSPGPTAAVDEGATAANANDETPSAKRSEDSSATGLLAGLDADQRRAAECVEGPLLIVAGPGTGKTRTLTYRIAHLVLERDVAPESCLTITFTRRAADEMRERLQSLLGDDVAKRVPVHTFHSFGLALLSEESDRLGLGATVRVAAAHEVERLVRSQLGLTPAATRKFLSQVSLAKRAGTPFTPTDGGAGLAEYEAILSAAGRLDFDDLLKCTVSLLERDADLLGVLRRRYRWISIDEYQDVDGLQYRMVSLLAPAAANVCAIGDPDQAIYGFRGADVGYFSRFEKDYPAARRVELTRNYRSSAAIVDVALAAVAPSSLVPGRRLVAASEPASGDAAPIKLLRSATEKSEAEAVVEAIEHLVGGSSFFALDSGRVESHETAEYSFQDIAVLYRTAAQAEPLVEAFSRAGIPFQQRSHSRLLDVENVALLVESMETLAAAAPGAGDSGVEELLSSAASGLQASTPESFEALESYLPSLRQAAAKASSMDAFLTELAMGVDVDALDPRAEAVTFLTLHASKGLEFPAVFVVGCDDGVLPLRFGGDCDALDEERRLFFVGMTRAERRLFLTRARRRPRNGKRREVEESPFLGDLPAERLQIVERRRPQKPKPEFQQLTLFDV